MCSSFWTGPNLDIKGSVDNAGQWLSERYGEVAAGVNDRVCRLGLPGDADVAKTAELLRDMGLATEGAKLYKAHARKYAEGLGVFAVSTEQTWRAVKSFEWDQGKTNAEISGLMLKMYLEEKLDPALIQRVNEAVAVSETFKWLVDFVEQQVQDELGKGSGRVGVMEIQKAAQKAMDLARRSKSAGGQSFYFGGEGLQPIIGGVTGLSPVNVQTKPRGFFSGDDTLNYTMSIRVSDTYDFENERRIKNKVTGAMEETQYSHFRTELTRLLTTHQYAQFELTYASAMCSAPTFGGDWNHIDRGHVFASYLYALEKAGYFKGLAWSTDVPTREMELGRKGVNMKPTAGSGPGF
jgi:hypothetical protein